MRNFVVTAVLLVASGAALAHPGHGALEIHWHLDDLAWVLLGTVVVFALGFLFGKRWKR